MTTYIPALTLPEAVFNSLPGSILLPIALGTAVGYSTKRRSHRNMFPYWKASKIITRHHPTANSIERANASLKHPPLRPPAAVFPPAWTALYGMMGYAAYRAMHFGTSPYSTSVGPPPTPLPCSPSNQADHHSGRPRRRNTLHDPAGPQPRLDATILWTQQANPSHRRCRPAAGHQLVPGLAMGYQGRQHVGLVVGAVCCLAWVRDLSVSRDGVPQQLGSDRRCWHCWGRQEEGMKRAEKNLAKAFSIRPCTIAVIMTKLRCIQSSTFLRLPL